MQAAMGHLTELSTRDALGFGRMGDMEVATHGCAPQKGVPQVLASNTEWNTTPTAAERYQRAMCIRIW